MPFGRRRKGHPQDRYWTEMPVDGGASTAGPAVTESLRPEPASPPAGMTPMEEFSKMFPGHDQQFGMVDSGKREEFSTGAHRDTQDDKPRYELVSPFALERLAMVYTNGAEKYGDNNWQKGIPYMRYLASALRHIYAYMRGETDEDHLMQAAWNLFAIAHHEAVGPAGLDDRPKYFRLPDLRGRIANAWRDPGEKSE